MTAASPEPGGGAATFSLKRRLLMWLVVPALSAVPLMSYAMYKYFYGTAIEWLDQSLGDTALALVSLIREQDGHLSLEIAGDADRALRFDRRDRVDVLVLDPQGRKLHGEARLQDLADATSAPAAGQWRFIDARLGSEPVRVARVRAACGSGQLCQVIVAETLHKRDDLRARVLLIVVLIVPALGALLVLGGWLAIRQGLRPLQRLGDEIEHRNLDSLAPLSTAVPAELSPLVAAFNRLFERLVHAATVQREFLADAAHQLRTPLTSLQTEVDLALLEPHAAEAEPLLRRLHASVVRCGRMAQQMLSMARAESDIGEPMRVLDLREIAAQLAEEWVPRALEQGVDLGFELDGAPVQGQGFLLRELLANLLHNSLSYAGTGARVTVRTRSAGPESLLEVEDNGPGIPAAERQRALRRFQRGHNTRGRGSGLGLAIASDIAHRHGGQLSLHDASAGTGLLVRLSLRRA